MKKDPPFDPTDSSGPFPFLAPDSFFPSIPFILIPLLSSLLDATLLSFHFVSKNLNLFTNFFTLSRYFLHLLSHCLNRLTVHRLSLSLTFLPTHMISDFILGQRQVYIHDAFQLHLQGGQQHALPSFDHSFKSNESNGINEKVGGTNFSSDNDNHHPVHLTLQHNHQSVQLNKPSHMVNGNGEVFSHHHQHNNGSISGNNAHGNHQSISNGDGKSGVNGNSSDDDAASRRQLTNNRLKTLIQNRQQGNKDSPDVNSNNGPANTSPLQATAVTDSAQHQISHPHPSPQPQLTELRNAAPILTPQNQYNTAQPVYTNQLQDPGYDYIDWSGILSYI